MSEITEKFIALNNLDKGIKNEIKLFHVSKCLNNTYFVCIVTNDDKVYAFHNKRYALNDISNCQLIMNLETQVIDNLYQKGVIDIKEGNNFFFARTVDGNVYFWRKNEKLEIFQLLKDQNIVDICCDSVGCIIALSNKGVVFISEKILSINDEAELIKVNLNKFYGEKVKGISSGGYHSLALTESGRAFIWTRNGVNSKLKSLDPELILLNDIVIEKISCSKEQYLLLSREGDIYLSMNNENCKPIKVDKFIHNESKDDEFIHNESKIERSSLENENKFIDIATHSHYDILIALSAKNDYYVCNLKNAVITFDSPQGSSSFSDILSLIQDRKLNNCAFKRDELELKSFDEIFAHYLQVTVKGIRIQSYNDFIRESKYSNNFIEISEIGSGSYGKVFKAKFKCTLQEFAIKKVQIKDENESFKELCTSLLISELNNELIVRYHDVWYENDSLKENGFQKYTENSTLYIQMDLCGKTLEKLCEEISYDLNLKMDEFLTPLGYFITSQLLFEILEGVDYLHKQNIIHRDLKPDNILLNEEAYDSFIKIADFGLAKLCEMKKLNTKDRGSVKYMAPEVDSSNKYDTKADIYSLGVIIEEIFHIDFDNLYEKEEILLSKYENLKYLVGEMTKRDHKNRPNCRKILENRSSWLLEGSLFGLETLKYFPKPHSFVYFMIETKLRVPKRTKSQPKAKSRMRV